LQVIKVIFNIQKPKLRAKKSQWRSIGIRNRFLHCHVLINIKTIYQNDKKKNILLYINIMKTLVHRTTTRTSLATLVYYV
jgi:hypothetical protein